MAPQTSSALFLGSAAAVMLVVLLFLVSLNPVFGQVLAGGVLGAAAGVAAAHAVLPLVRRTWPAFRRQ